jgi:hypothetical protein
VPVDRLLLSARRTTMSDDIQATVRAKGGRTALTGVQGQVRPGDARFLPGGATRSRPVVTPRGRCRQ